jgi:hypothetical protein
VAQALLSRAAALGVTGVAAPSANRFGRVSPTTAAHVAQEFGGRVHVLDGGASFNASKPLRIGRRRRRAAEGPSQPSKISPLEKMTFSGPIASISR